LTTLNVVCGFGWWKGAVRAQKLTPYAVLYIPQQSYLIPRFQNYFVVLLFMFVYCWWHFLFRYVLGNWAWPKFSCSSLPTTLLPSQILSCWTFIYSYWGLDIPFLVKKIEALVVAIQSFGTEVLKVFWNSRIDAPLLLYRRSRICKKE